MKIPMQVAWAGSFHEAADEIAELERAGPDPVRVAEARGVDAPRPMGSRAASPSRARVASGSTTSSVSLAGRDRSERVGTLDRLRNLVEAM